MAIDVLIVDDSPTMRDLVGKVVRLSGIEVGGRFDANNGAEALKVMDEHPIDLVLVDINMPVMNGEELVREMSHREKLSKLPVIVISSDGTNVRKKRMHELGVVGYLQKPFRPEQLRNEVERIMALPPISPEEISTALTDAATRVLETVCFCCVDEVADLELDPLGTPIGVSVRFSGTMAGKLELWVSEAVEESLAMNSLGEPGERCDAAVSGSMLSELANMMCGAALATLCPDGEFSIETPSIISAVEHVSVMGRRITSDDGSIWVSLEVSPSEWNAKKQLVY